MRTNTALIIDRYILRLSDAAGERFSHKTEQEQKIENLVSHLKRKEYLTTAKSISLKQIVKKYKNNFH